MMGRPKKHHHYSGPGSAKFWERVNRLPDDERPNLYTAGVLLQNMEETILKWLDNAERRGSPHKGKE